MYSALMSVIACMRHAHDVQLLWLAGLVCVAGIYASFAVARHAARATGKVRTRWGLVSVVASGCTAWATHFIVLLAFKPGMPAAFEPWLTALSLACAIVGIGAGVSLSIRSKRPAMHFVAGQIVGIGVALLHYVGQDAYLVQGVVTWNLWLVIPSILVSLPLSGLALMAMASRNRRVRVAAAPLLLFSIALLHFFGMAAMTLRFDPTARFPHDAVSPQAITPVVSGVALLLIALAVLGWRFDVAAKLRLRRDRQRLRELADVALEGLLICHDGVVVTVNRSIERLTGHLPGSLAGHSISDLLPGLDVAAMPEREERDSELVAADGKTVPVRVLRHEVELGHRVQTVIAVRDQRERLRTEAQIRTLAFHDSLTGLYNRGRFFDLLAMQTASRRESDQVFAVMMLDLDSFKPVNDMLGHAAGDAVLKMVTQRLRSTLREHDIIARLGGDEFAILQMVGAAEGGADVLAARIVDAISSCPFLVEDQTIKLGISVGIAMAPEDGDDPAHLMQNADLALYAAKADGKATHRRYDAALDEAMRDRRTLEAEMRLALVEGQFEVHYQPLVDARTRRVSSAEALVRWNHPQRGRVMPADFIPVAEETGMIVALGEWVLRTACVEAVRWPEKMSVAVNLSPAQFRDHALLDQVKNALSQSGLSPNRLEIEITEGILLSDEVRTLELLNALRALGIRISMDDFGTGYSSLSYLRRFPFDKIKIDQSFVRQVPQDSESAAIVRAIITMGSCLGMSTTVEGVETLEQFDFSVSEGCDTIQGYHVSKPLDRATLSAFIKADERSYDLGLAVEVVPC